jgi:hypothetical protein
MAQVSTQGLEPSHTPHVTEHSHMFLMELIKKGNKPVQKDIIAPDYNKDAMIRG